MTFGEACSVSLRLADKLRGKWVSWESSWAWAGGWEVLGFE